MPHDDDLWRYFFAILCACRLDLDEDGVISWDEVSDRLKEVRDNEPERHAERLNQTGDMFMSKKVIVQQALGTTLFYHVCTRPCCRTAGN